MNVVKILSLSLASLVAFSLFAGDAGDPPNAPFEAGKPWEPAWGYWEKAPTAWVPTFKKNVARTKQGGIDVVFYGDSITQGWTGKGKAVFEKEYAPLKAVDYGIGGDSTRQLIWRMAHGELEGLSPKLAVLMIGTNNLYGNANGGSDAEIAKGVEAVVKTLQEKAPGAKILLLGILPRQNEYFCGRIKNVNEIISKLDDGSKVRFLDMAPAFQEGFGKVKKELYVEDQVHLSEKGYELWAETMRPLFNEMLGAK